MCFPNARLSKYSTIATPALAVQEPSEPWFSIGGHHARKSTVAGKDTFAAFSLHLPAGKSQVQAWLIDMDEKAQGAYYVYVKKT